MALSLKNKKILLGVTGGIAAYKAAELARLLIKAGAVVQVVMSKNATEFIQPLTFEAITGKRVLLDLFDSSSTAMQHIEAARFSELIIIAPASASFMARLAYGFADDLLSTICLATQAPIFLAPAMNKHMWENLATQNNLKRLVQQGIQVLETDIGDQACGDVGYGRMLEPIEIFDCLKKQFSFGSGSLTNKKVVITVGATQEPIDAVRYISNCSSGKMGFELAKAFSWVGAEVTLICGICALSPPKFDNIIQVKTAKEMLEAALEKAVDADIFVGAAAVSDYRVQNPMSQKLKSTKDHFSLDLTKNPDILLQVASLPKKPFMVGFALETENLMANARKKLKQKGLNMIVANSCEKITPFDSDENEVFILNDANDEVLHLERNSKFIIAKNIIHQIKKQFL
jgi:phosphopantothenoylcysteine decarboxylase / phosphopantothenate---cysteine ligase